MAPNVHAADIVVCTTHPNLVAISLPAVGVTDRCGRAGACEDGRDDERRAPGAERVVLGVMAGLLKNGG
jgi:hypothetical protein